MEINEEIKADSSEQKPSVMQITTEYNRKIVASYLRWLSFIPMLICTIFGTLLIIGGILLCILIKPPDTGMAVILFGLLFACIYSIPYLFAPAIAKRQTSVKWHQKTKLIFGNDKITGTDESGVSSPKDIELQWYIFIKAAETKTCFYLFWDKRNALIIQKADIQNGTPDDLRRLFTEKLGSKMKSIKKG